MVGLANFVSSFGGEFSHYKYLKSFISTGASSTFQTSWTESYSSRVTDLYLGINGKAGLILGKIFKVDAFYEYLYGVLLILYQKNKIHLYWSSAKNRKKVKTFDPGKLSRYRSFE